MRIETMMKLAYLECPTGISGDMCLGALVHAGVPLDYLIEQLSHLGIDQEYKLGSELVHHNGQQATKVHVDLLRPESAHSSLHEEGIDPHTTFAYPFNPTESEINQHNAANRHGYHPPHGRHLPEIEQIIEAATLPPRAQAWSLAIFRKLAAAEGAVHGIVPEHVHFHEVGATDAIVDIVGTCLGLDWLGIESLYCSPLPTGGGIIRAAHGQLPVPTPAVLKLWEMHQVPIYSNGINRELVTPTGAAIATTLATQFGPPPPMTLQQVGLGAGSRHLPIPNILRLWIGTPVLNGGQHLDVGTVSPRLNADPSSPSPQETIVILETQIDDLNPQAIGYVFDVLLTAGALDVFTQAIGMKKNRPGILLTGNGLRNHFISRNDHSRNPMLYPATNNSASGNSDCANGLWKSASQSCSKPCPGSDHKCTARIRRLRSISQNP
jgi:pyridinium-3,5-bisthiocarboxylic acid mononucleotide nickel chelatase